MPCSCNFTPLPLQPHAPGGRCVSEATKPRASEPWPESIKAFIRAVLASITFSWYHSARLMNLDDTCDMNNSSSLSNNQPTKNAKPVFCLKHIVCLGGPHPPIRSPLVARCRAPSEIRTVEEIMMEEAPGFCRNWLNAEMNVASAETSIYIYMYEGPPCIM